MKKIITLACALSCIIGASAQSIYDAAKLAEKDLNGTARFVGMGGAMGALGGDITTMGTNPAGIGIYRSNDVMTSFSFSAYGAESKYDRETFNNDKNRWSFDNIGFVFSTKVGNETPLRYVNFGFNYKRSKSLYKNMSMAGFMGVLIDLYHRLTTWRNRLLTLQSMFGIHIENLWTIVTEISIVIMKRDG